MPFVGGGWREVGSGGRRMWRKMGLAHKLKYMWDREMKKNEYFVPPTISPRVLSINHSFLFSPKTSFHNPPTKVCCINDDLDLKIFGGATSSKICGRCLKLHYHNYYSAFLRCIKLHYHDYYSAFFGSHSHLLIISYWSYLLGVHIFLYACKPQIVLIFFW